MSSTNTSGRSTGCISIPIEIVPGSNSTNSNSRHNSSFHTLRNENPYSDFSNSPPWKKPSMNSYSTSRFQPRQNPHTAYDRLINNQPMNDRHSHQRMYEPNSSHASRSNEDLLSSPMESMRYNTPSQNTSFYPPTMNNGFRSNSDFIQPNKSTNSLRRSHDALNDFPDTHQNFPINRQYPSEQQQQQSYYRPTYVNQTFTNPNIIYSNEYRVPINRHQSNTSQRIINSSHDRSHSPASQRGESPARPPPPPVVQQQQQESDFKITKDATGSIPISGPIPTPSSSQSNDQQVPSTDTSSSTPIRDPNIIALEKLEQIKQNLADLNQQVDTYTGLTRNDRIYKELDEQALKMMMRCDELIEVSADIKEKRKETIRNVQTVLAKLESKVPINPAIEYNSNQMDTALVIYNPSVNKTEQQKSSNSQKEETSIQQSM